MRKLLFLFCIVVGCTTKVQPTKPIFKTEILDTIGRSKFFAELYGKGGFERKYIDNNTLPFYSLKNGVDSLEIRLSIDLSLTNGGSLYIIKYVNKNWMGEAFYYTIKSGCLDTMLMGTFSPMCGWKEFIDSLNNYGLYDLPSQRQIEHFIDEVTDGTDYTIEFATKNRYKRFNFHEPEGYTDSINKKFWKIILFWNKNSKLSGVEWAERSWKEIDSSNSSRMGTGWLERMMKKDDSIKQARHL